MLTLAPSFRPPRTRLLCEAAMQHRPHAPRALLSVALPVSERRAASTAGPQELASHPKLRRRGLPLCTTVPVRGSAKVRLRLMHAYGLKEYGFCSYAALIGYLLHDLLGTPEHQVRRPAWIACHVYKWLAAWCDSMHYQRHTFQPFHWPASTRMY